jgi:hypothetical protein
MDTTSRAKTMRGYLKSDRKWLVVKASTVRFLKREITRMNRRANKSTSNQES